MELLQNPHLSLPPIVFDYSRSTETNRRGEDTDAAVKNSASGKNISAVHMKLCTRGHWRPIEDDKLKELVAHFGPQNWNLIAEHLDGRSGTIPL